MTHTMPSSYDDRGLAEYSRSLEEGDCYEDAIAEALSNPKCIEDLGGSLKDHEYVAFHQLIASGDLLEAGHAYQKFCRNALERDCKTAQEVLDYIGVCK